MARVCQLTGKKKSTGNRVSHSNRKNKREFGVNLQKKTLVNPATGRKMTMKLSAKAIKTLSKWDAEGKKYDLRQLLVA